MGVISHGNNSMQFNWIYRKKVQEQMQL